MPKKASFSNVMALQRKPMMLEGTDVSTSTKVGVDKETAATGDASASATPGGIKRAPKTLEKDRGIKVGVRGDQEDRRPVRRGKRALTFWVNAEAHKQFKVLCATEDRPGQELLEMALDNLFAQFGKHRIARDH